MTESFLVLRATARLRVGGEANMRSCNLHFIGMISCGMTGRIFLLPPLASRSSIPCKREASSERRTERDGLYLDGKEDVRVLCLPQPIKEKWQIIVIVQRLQRDFPRDPVAPAVVLERYRKVSPVVALSEG